MATFTYATESVDWPMSCKKPPTPISAVQQ